MQQNVHFDVIIAGAGPSGSACALQLAKSGLRVALVDKAVFPRDKICGDAIGGRVLTVLNKIDPDLLTDLNQFSKKSISAGWKVVAPNGKQVEMFFTKHGYVSKRIDFDNFLVDLVRKKSGITLIEGKEISEVVINENFVTVKLQEDETFFAKIIVGCDGAHSIVQKNTVGRKVDESSYSGAVRQYFSNVKDVKEGIIEIHLIKGFLPGYFWIFPLPDNQVNVGFGMLSKDISRKRIDLKKSITDIIQQSPELKDRFTSAKALEKPKGFGLPLGGKKRPLSGHRFLLCGDAAWLIDPLNGEGIGNGMLSGYCAAGTIVSAFKTGDFTSDFLKHYDQQIEEKLMPELRQKLFLQKLFNRPWLINKIISWSASNKFLRSYIGKKL